MSYGSHHLSRVFCGARPVPVLLLPLPLHAPTTLGATPRVDVELAHDWLHDGQFFLVLLIHRRGLERSATRRAPGGQRRRAALVDPRWCTPSAAAARRGPSSLHQELTQLL